MPAPSANVFDFMDEHTNLSSHMSESSWMMGGGHMQTQIDDGKGRQVGSHIRLNGKVLGIPIFLDEVITQHQRPYRKTWQTVGNIRLLVIGHYTMGFEIQDENQGSKLEVFICYQLPEPPPIRWLGYLAGNAYAHWCVQQILGVAQKKFW